MNICIVTDGYPTPINPGFFVFVDQLVSAWADMRIEVSVINPIPFGVELFDKKRFYKKEWEKKTAQGNTIKIFSPRFFRVSDRKVGYFDTKKISYQSFQQAVIQTIKSLNKPDILYSHFLLSGCQVGDIGQLMNIPAFCAFGESSLWSIEGWDQKRIQYSLDKLSGIISVSTENKRVLIANHLFRENDIEVFPNGVDHTLFYPRDKNTVRRKYGFEEDSFIGVYTGSFNNDKGVLRAQEAAVNAGNIQMIFIGGGEQKPEGDNIVFCGKLQHDIIPEYLSAADFFILPTKAEGCCNAIVEAMACGLPIISAEGAYNDDILAEAYSIRTDPMDISAMAKAIEILRDKPNLRSKMSIAARNASAQFDITKRARAIIDFMQRKFKKEI